MSYKKESKIAQLNKKISSEIGEVLRETSAESNTHEEILAKYEAYIESEKTVQVCFDSCDTDGTFTTYDGDVLIILPGSDVKEAYAGVDRHERARMLNINFELKVVSIDRETSRVYCEIPGGTKEQIQLSLRKVINREILDEVRKENRPLVWGKIIKVEARYAMVDILGQGVLGFIDVSKWQKCYTRSLLGMCQPGEFYQFEIIKAMPKLKGKDTAWSLSRKDITVDAWRQIDLTNIQEGSTLLVKCIEKKDNYWWGGSDRLRGIEVMGDYTERFKRNGLLLEGITYKCKVKEMRIEDDHKKNIFKVVPFDVVQDDMAKVAAVQSLRQPINY